MPEFDIVINVGSDDTDLAKLAINCVQQFSGVATIHVISSKKRLEYFSSFPRVELHDENTIVPGVTLQKITEYLKKKGFETDCFGWYFQQILKMGWACRKESSEYYLIWDADLIPLRKIDFFNNKNLVKLQMIYLPQEDMRAYTRLTSLQPVYRNSLISEHMMIK